MGLQKKGNGMKSGSQRGKSIGTRLRFCLAMALTASTVLTANATGAKPKTIPAVKQWNEGSGSFLLAPSSRIVVDQKSVSALTATAEVFASDVSNLSGWKLPVSAGRPRSGDIYLRLSPVEAGMGAEGYKAVISERIEISALTDAGVFYGTRTLLQLFAQSRVVRRGVIRDWPDYRERGLMVDVGRKYYSVQWLENQIRDLAYQKLNYLHLHLSDNLGFRIESETHPELNKNTSPCYAKAEMRMLVALGKQYHVTIIPELELLAHADPILAVHPELRLVGRNGEALADKMDLSLPATRALVSDLLNEYLKLFPGRYWAAGADEYLHPGEYADFPQLQAYARARWGPAATGIDTFLGYVNWMDGVVKAHGKAVRTWGDPYEFLAYTGRAVGLNKDIVLEPWNGLVNPQEMIRAGYTITNANFRPLYYILGNSPPDAKEIYEKWAPNLEFGKEGQWSVDKRDPHLRGAKFFIWSDTPSALSEDEVADRTQNCIRGVAQNTWGSQKLVSSYAEFADVIHVLGRAPGWGKAAGPIAVTPIFSAVRSTSKSKSHS